MEEKSRSLTMNLKHMCIAITAAAALVVPPVLAAQTDPNASGGSPFPQSPQTFPQSPGGGNQPASQGGVSQSSGVQAGQAASMRDTLGAPGQTGQQMLDKQFVRAAAQGGMGDVKLGTLAMEKGGPDVKTAAQKMVDDHTAMNKDMDTVADALGVMVPKKMSKEDQAEYDKLNGLSGKDFDTEYLTYIVKAHWATLHDFYMEATAAADPDLQAEVVKDLGTMHQHLGLIAKTATAEGITLPPRPPRPGAATTANK
jgi:putative membrane protein